MLEHIKMSYHLHQECLIEIPKILTTHQRFLHTIMNFAPFPTLMVGDFMDFSHLQTFLMRILWIVIMLKHLFLGFNLCLSILDVDGI